MVWTLDNCDLLAFVQGQLTPVAYHLLGHHDNCLDGEASVAMIKEILKGWSEQVDNQDVVETFLAKVVDIWNARCEIISKMLLSICAVRLLTASDEDLVGTVLVAQLWCVRLAWLLK